MQRTEKTKYALECLAQLLFNPSCKLKNKPKASMHISLENIEEFVTLSDPDKKEISRLCRCTDTKDLGQDFLTKKEDYFQDSRKSDHSLFYLVAFNSEMFCKIIEDQKENFKIWLQKGTHSTSHTPIECVARLYLNDDQYAQFEELIKSDGRTFGAKNVFFQDFNDFKEARKQLEQYDEVQQYQKQKDQKSDKEHFHYYKSELNTFLKGHFEEYLFDGKSSDCDYEVILRMDLSIFIKETTAEDQICTLLQMLNMYPSSFTKRIYTAYRRSTIFEKLVSTSTIQTDRTENNFSNKKNRLIFMMQFDKWKKNNALREQFLAMISPPENKTALTPSDSVEQENRPEEINDRERWFLAQAFLLNFPKNKKNAQVEYNFFKELIQRKFFKFDKYDKEGQHTLGLVEKLLRIESHYIISLIMIDFKDALCRPCSSVEKIYAEDGDELFKLIDESKFDDIKKIKNIQIFFNQLPSVINYLYAKAIRVESQYNRDTKREERHNNITVIRELHQDLFAPKKEEPTKKQSRKTSEKKPSKEISENEKNTETEIEREKKMDSLIVRLWIDAISHRFFEKLYVSLLKCDQHSMLFPNRHNFFGQIVNILRFAEQYELLSTFYQITIEKLNEFRAQGAHETVVDTLISYIDKLDQTFQTDKQKPPSKALAFFLTHNEMTDREVVFPYSYKSLDVVSLSQFFPDLIGNLFEVCKKNSKKKLYDIDNNTLPALMHFLHGKKENFKKLQQFTNSYPPEYFWLHLFVNEFSLFYDETTQKYDSQFKRAFDFVYSILESLNLFKKTNKDELRENCKSYLKVEKWYTYEENNLKSKKDSSEIIYCKMLVCMFLHGLPTKHLYQAPLLFAAQDEEMLQRLKDPIRSYLKDHITIRKKTSVFKKGSKHDSQLKSSNSKITDAIELSHIFTRHVRKLTNKKTLKLHSDIALKIKRMRLFLDHFREHSRSVLHLLTVINEDTAISKDSDAYKKFNFCITGIQALNNGVNDSSTTNLGVFQMANKSIINLICTLAKGTGWAIQFLSHTLTKSAAQRTLKYLDVISNGRIELLMHYTAIACCVRFQNIICLFPGSERIINQQIDTLSKTAVGRIFYFIGKHDANTQDGERAKIYRNPVRWLYSKNNTSIHEYHPYANVLSDALTSQCPDDESLKFEIGTLSLSSYELFTGLPSMFGRYKQSKNLESNQAERTIRQKISKYCDEHEWFLVIGNSEYTKNKKQKNVTTSLFFEQKKVTDVHKTTRHFLDFCEEEIDDVREIFDGFFPSASTLSMQKSIK